MLINSKDNGFYKRLKGLLTGAKLRKELGMCVLEGVHLCQVALATQRVQALIVVQQAPNDEVDALITAAEAKGIDVVYLAAHLYANITTLGHSVPVMALINQPSHYSYAPTALLWPCCDVLVLDNVQDAGNVGTLMRTASAAGVKHVITTAGTAHAFAPKVLRAGMGAQLNLAIAEHVPMDVVLGWLAGYKGKVLATSSHATAQLYSLNLQAPVAWVLGNEGAGVSPQLQGHIDLVTVPQPGGEESLNVASAGAVCMFEMVRQRL